MSAPLGREPTGIYIFSVVVHRRWSAPYRKVRDPFSVSIHLARRRARRVHPAALTNRSEYPVEILRSSYLPRMSGGFFTRISIQLCPTQVGCATSRQRPRMRSNISSGKGPAATAAPFSINRPSLVVPTIAVCTPGTLRVKRRAVAIVFFKAPCSDSYFNFCNLSQ